MKRLLIVAVLVAFAGTPTRADSRKNMWYGALMGAATGAVIGHYSDIDTGVAVATSAAIGGLIGYGYDRGWYTSRGYSYPAYYDGYYGHQDYRRYGRYDRYRARGDVPRYRYDMAPRYRHDVTPWYRTRDVVVVHPRVVKEPRQVHSPRKPANPAPPDRFPGVEMVRVPVKLANGVSVDFRILKVNGRFVGPQGEEYETLPTSEKLAETYGARS